MKRNYILGSLVFVALFSLSSMLIVNAQASPTVGNFQFSPSNIKNGESFSIKLVNADNIPSNTATRLFIDTDEGSGFSGFKDFGEWLSVGALKNGITRTMNCSAYSSYNPSGSVNVSGKILSQKLYVVYEGVGSQSAVVSHVKDCSTPPPTSGSACSVSPASVNITQNGTVNMSVSTSRTSTSGDRVYVTASGFPAGSYSSLGNGQAIEAGRNRKDFQIFSTNNANRGQSQFTVYCSTGCPVSGCPSGGAPEVLGSANVSINVSGNNTEPSTGGGGSGGGSGSDQCRVPNVSLPPNSSFYLPLDVDYPASGSVSFSGSSGQDISATPIHSSIKYEGALQNGREAPSVIVRTGANFSGGSYSVSCKIPGGSYSAIGNATLPAVSNPSGKIKLSQVEYLSDTMFPKSECPYNVPGCRTDFYSGGSGPRVVTSFDPPALIGGDKLALYPAPAKGGSATVRYFSLADPMNPARVESMTGLTIREENDAFGDYGAALSMNSVAYSRDGKYSAAVSSQGWLFVRTPTQSKVRVHSDIFGEISIIKSGSNYILLYDGGAMNITGVKESLDGFTSLEPLPSNFPNFHDSGYTGVSQGYKMVLGNDSYILDIPAGSRFGAISNPKIKLFSVDQRDAIAEFEIPTDSLSNGAYGALQNGKISFSGGEYVYTIRPSAGSQSTPMRQWLVDVFKVEYSAKKISQVVKGVALPAGAITGSAGFDVGGNLGIITFGYLQQSTNYNVEPYGNPIGRIRAFLISDLIAGKVVDTLSNSPVTLPAPGRPLGTGVAGPLEYYASPLVKNGITYIYTTNSFGMDVSVWKFELNDGSSGGLTPPVINPPTGGGSTSTVPTYDCNFDLSFIPADLTVKQGTYFANYTIKANSSSINPFCTISVIPPGQNSIRSDFVSTLLVSPGGQASMLLNISKATKGSYVLPVKASAKGVPTKTYNVNLTIQ